MKELTQITNLYQTYLSKNVHQMNENDKTRIINNAFKIYENIDTKHKDKYYELTSKLLSICLHYKYPNKSLFVWNNIKNINDLNTNNDIQYLQSLYDALIQCFIIANNVNINECIEIIEWIKTNHSNITQIGLHGFQITKWIKKCTDIDSLLYVEKLLNQNFIKHIDNKWNNIIIKTALIDCIGKYDIHHALDIFDSIKDSDKNIVCIGVMMSLLINNNQSIKALEIYHNTAITKDISSHILALKACNNCNDIKTGQMIIDSNKLLNINIDNIRLKTTLIDFYGHFKYINNAINIFNSIDNDKKDMVIINAMIKAYGNNECIDKAYDLYNDNKLIADKRSYVILLNGLSHFGDIDKAINIWEYEIINISIKYNLLVMSALIDGLSRKGYIYTAYQYVCKYNKYHNIKQKDFDHVMYTSLLSGCRERKNKYFAQYICNQIKSIDMSENRKVSIQRLISNT